VSTDDLVLSPETVPGEPVDGSDFDPVRESILRVTLGLLEENGCLDVTTEAIATSARVSKATIYRYWRSKQQIIVDATRLRFGPIEPPDLGSFEEEVRWILAKRLGDYRQTGTIRLVAGIIGASTADDELRAVFDEWIEYLSRAIRRVVQRGIARKDIDPDVDIFALETIIAGVVSRAVVMGRSFSDVTIDHVVGLLAAAARPAPG
jgi:AcrR family transcriptional regulator